MGIENAAAEIKKWGKSALYYVKTQFKVEPDAWQREALEALSSDDPKKQRISLQACAGPGKTALEAWCGWWFL